MNAAKRNSLQKSDFVYPPGSPIGGSQGKYPIDTKKRARAALRYSARSDTAGTYRTVSRRVAKRYPSLATKGATKSAAKAAAKAATKAA